MRNKNEKIIKAPVLSLNAKIEQLALFLRKKVKEELSSVNKNISSWQPTDLNPTHTIKQLSKKLKNTENMQSKAKKKKKVA